MGESLATNLTIPSGVVVVVVVVCHERICVWVVERVLWRERERMKLLHGGQAGGGGGGGGLQQRVGGTQVARVGGELPKVGLTIHRATPRAHVLTVREAQVGLSNAKLLNLTLAGVQTIHHALHVAVKKGIVMAKVNHLGTSLSTKAGIAHTRAVVAEPVTGTSSRARVD